jgi:hypothetical protein
MIAEIFQTLSLFYDRDDMIIQALHWEVGLNI